MANDIIEEQNDQLFPGAESAETAASENSAQSELNTKISELSKNGYILLKTNDVEGAIQS